MAGPGGGRQPRTKPRGDAWNGAAKRLMAVLLAAFVLLLAHVAAAQDLTGRVVGITDGDTLTLLVNRRQQVRVRLSDIDTPERRQPYGTRARQDLSGLVFRKTVRVVVRDTDRYGRTVGRVHAGAVDVNAELVRLGAAWVYRDYSNDPALLRLEATARCERRGLWRLPEAERVPPWEWRALRRHGPGARGAATAAPPDGSSATSRCR